MALPNPLAGITTTLNKTTDAFKSAAPPIDVATPQPTGGLSSSNPISFVSPKPSDTNIPTTFAPSTPPPATPPPIGGDTIAPPPANTATPAPSGGLNSANPIAVNKNTGAPIPPPVDTTAPEAPWAPTPEYLARNAKVAQGMETPKIDGFDNKTGLPTDNTTPPKTDTTTTSADNTATVTAQPKTEPSLDDGLKVIQQQLADMAAGKIDPAVFRTTANRAILQMGLNNQAQTDALQMRINQDPSLAGQGAGRALLMMMGANQNFSADQMFGQLAQDAQQKILDLQKYGITQGMQVNAQRRQNALSNIQLLQDAGDFHGAAEAMTKLIDMPGVTIDPSQFSTSRARTVADAATLGASGDFVGQAKKLSQLTGQTVDPASLQNRDPKEWDRFSQMIANGDYEGAATQGKSLGLNVTADQLRVRDPYMQGLYADQMQQAKGLASTDPARAEALINSMMQNPALKDHFAPGLTAHDLVQQLLTGQYQQNQDIITQSNTEINAKALSNTPFLQALTDYRNQPAAAWQAFENQGKSLATSDLTAFNAARAKAGLGQFHKDASGNIVDDKGTPVTDEDFGETAAAADYNRRHDNANKDPIQTAYDQLYNGPLKDKILSIPGGEATVKSTLATLYAGGGYSVDPQTGLIKGDYTSGLPWENAKTKYMYHNWPAANFNTDGSVNGKYDIGGEAYGDTIGGTKIQKLPDDEALDSNYQKYQYNGGDLSASQWYFATAGGTKPMDKTKIPTELNATTGPDLTNPGNTTATPGATTPATGTTTTPAAVGSRAADSAAFADIINENTQSTDPAVAASVIDMGRKVSDAYISKPVGTMTPLDTGSTTQFAEASSRLQQKFGLTPADMAKFADQSAVKDGLLSTRNAWSGTPAFAYYAIYTNMVNNGLPEASAKTALVKLVGQANADAALGLESAHNASPDYNPNAISSGLAGVNKGFSAPPGGAAPNPYDMSGVFSPLNSGGSSTSTSPQPIPSNTGVDVVPPKKETLLRPNAIPVGGVS